MNMTATKLAQLISSKDISVREAVSESLDRISTLDKDYNCFITINENALKEADKLQKRINTSDVLSPLAGVPVAIKDNICTSGIKTTCGSRMLCDFVPPYNATVIDALTKAGAIIIGKTNMDEFAMGSTTETSYFGATKNPMNVKKVPGGSSGGSAAAVALNLVPYALGSDTGGSIRQPAAFCGVNGFKPTYGRVSRYGLVAYASSLDQIGPMARSVEDLAGALEIICGNDSRDSTSSKRPVERFTQALTGDIKGIRVGIPVDYFDVMINPDIREQVYKAAGRFKDMGAVVEEFKLGMTEYAVPAYYLIAAAQASSNLERYDGIKYGYRTKDYKGLHSLYKRTRSEGFGTEVKRRIMLGSFALSQGYYDEYYVKALKVKKLVKQSFDMAFCRYDVILAPVTPDVAPDLGESFKDNIKMYMGDVYTVGANLAGIPAVSIPAGFDKNKMPIGVQLMAPAFGESTLLNVAYAYEQSGQCKSSDIKEV